MRRDLRHRGDDEVQKESHSSLTRNKRNSLENKRGGSLYGRRGRSSSLHLSTSTLTRAALTTARTSDRKKMKVGRVQGDSGGFEVCFVTYGGRHKIVANTSSEVITYRPPDMFLCL